MKKFEKVTLGDLDVTSELKMLVDNVGLDRVANGRYSIMLVMDLYFLMRFGGLNPDIVVSEIKVLEGVGSMSAMKPAKPFNGKYLSGLYHKHYFDAAISSMAVNIMHEWKRNKYGIPLFEQKIKDSELTDEVQYMRLEDIAIIAGDMVSGNLNERARRGEMTGEWIVYAEIEGVKYYLCLGRHNDGDEYIRKKIDGVCCTEFPFLNTILSSVPKITPSS